MAKPYRKLPQIIKVKRVEQHGGHPARVEHRKSGDPGILRIDFPEAVEDVLQEVTINGSVNSKKITLHLYQKEKASSEDSTFSN